MKPITKSLLFTFAYHLALILFSGAIWSVYFLWSAGDAAADGGLRDEGIGIIFVGALNLVIAGAFALGQFLITAFGPLRISILNTSIGKIILDLIMLAAYFFSFTLGLNLGAAVLMIYERISL